MKKRILLKISGEAFSGENKFGVNIESAEKIAQKISSIVKKDINLAIVVGGGNIYRGSDLISAGIFPADSHNLSMLSTVFNGVILKSVLEKYSIKSTVFDPNGIKFLSQYNRYKAINDLENGNVVIFVGGTGNPYFTTDSGGVLRSLELNCEMMIKATKVDGVYDKDPIKFRDAKLFDSISYDEAINKNLKIIDQTALVMARDNKLIIKVVNFNTDFSIEKAIFGEKIGTIISYR